MIETIVKNYLDEHTTVPVRLERTPNMPGKCIVIEKTGGGYRESIWSATMAVQSYGTTLNEAAGLNQDVVNLMLQMRDTTDSIYDVTLNSDYNFTDASTKRYRYQAVFNILYYTNLGG